MTAGTLEKVYRLRDPRMTLGMTAVLGYYAYRAYYPDGRAAWPSVATVAAACGCDEKTVRTCLSKLVEIGFMRVSPDQAWNVRDAETGRWKRANYRTRVYDVLPENFPVLDDEGEGERAGDRAAGRGDAPGQAGEGLSDGADTPGRACRVEGGRDARSAETVGMKPIRRAGVTPALEKPADAEAGVTPRLSGRDAHQLTNDQLILPSAPSGHLPMDASDSGGTAGAVVVAAADASDACPADAGGDLDAEPWADGTACVGADASGPEASEVEWASGVCRRLRERRLAAGFTAAPEPTHRDVAAVARLTAGDPAGRLRVEAALVYALQGRFWPKRVRTGRDLAAHCAEIADDMTADLNADAAMACRPRHAATADGSRLPDASASPGGGITATPAQHTHSAHCRHVDSILDGPRLRAVEPSHERRHVWADLAATLLNDPTITSDDAARTIAVRALDARRDLERQLADLERLRAENGGRRWPGGPASRDSSATRMLGVVS